MTPRQFERRYSYDRRLVTGEYYSSDPLPVEPGDTVGQGDVIGAIGAALTLGARRGGVLMSLLILPLYIPVLIFGAGAIDAALMGFAVRPHLLLLGGILTAALPLAPLAAAAALRQALQ